MSLNAEQVLSGADAFVVKVGGATAGEFEENAQFPQQMKESAGSDVPVGLVVSAVRSSAPAYARFATVEPERGFNTTSHLLAMAEAARSGDEGEAARHLNAARIFTRQLIEDKARDDRGTQLVEASEAAFARLEQDVIEAARLRHFGREAQFPTAGEDRLYAPLRGGMLSFTAFGEELAEELLAVNVNASRVGYAQESSAYLDSKGENFDPDRAARASLDQLPSQLEGVDGRVWVMGGARPGRMNSRGYSDVAAVDAMNAWSAHSGRVLVVAKERPIMSVDPKISRAGRLVPGIRLNAATELFGPHGMDAAALHPDAVKNLRHPCVVFNPGNVSRGMTLVSDQCEVREGVLVVGFKKVPTIVRVSSPDMADRHGVFSRVMDALREATLSHAYTSEGCIIVTVNGKVEAMTMSDLEARLRVDLDPSYQVRVENNGHAMVFALGNALSGAREVGCACTALDNAGVRVLFQDLVTEAGVMKFVVSSGDASKAVGVLHEALVENAATLSS